MLGGVAVLVVAGLVGQRWGFAYALAVFVLVLVFRLDMLIEEVRALRADTDGLMTRLDQLSRDAAKRVHLLDLQMSDVASGKPPALSPEQTERAARFKG